MSYLLPSFSLPPLARHMIFVTKNVSTTSLSPPILFLQIINALQKGVVSRKIQKNFYKKYGPHLSARTVSYWNCSYLSFQNDISSIIPKWVIQIYFRFLVRLMEDKTVVLKWCRRPFDMMTCCRIDMTDDVLFESDNGLCKMKMTLFQKWRTGIFGPLLRL